MVVTMPVALEPNTLSAASIRPRPWPPPIATTFLFSYRDIGFSYFFITRSNLANLVHNEYPFRANFCKVTIFFWLRLESRTIIKYFTSSLS
ncbi:Uncharacterised protein [Vibrio cholerae]|nr:Uncharacterised protein [Vibrio cholerae]CSD07013.1 Uncharacterised protein [Vibrio cholerae]